MGILLLNSKLTVAEEQACSQRKFGWGGQLTNTALALQHAESMEMGMLLLNSNLTVAEEQACSQRKFGWGGSSPPWLYNARKRCAEEADLAS